jgi:hypothetical protein
MCYETSKRPNKGIVQVKRGICTGYVDECI